MLRFDLFTGGFIRLVAKYIVVWLVVLLINRTIVVRKDGNNASL